MSTHCEVMAKKAVGAEMGFFERYPTVWVLPCIRAGIVLGRFFNGACQAIAAMAAAQVHRPVVVLIDASNVFELPSPPPSSCSASSRRQRSPPWSAC